MKAGKYWVGDLCYVIREDWTEVCDLMFANDQLIGGEFELKDGTKFAVMSTAYGDGTYYDQNGHDYGVDAGVIGCILVDDIKDNSDNYIKGGHVIEFPEDFTVSYDDGLINFGNLVKIETGDGPCCDEEEDQYDFYESNGSDDEDDYDHHSYTNTLI